MCPRAGLPVALGLLLLAVGTGSARAGTSTSPTPTVIFTTPGTKQVTLQVCNSHGCGTVTKNVVVLSPVPAITSVTVPASVVVGQTVTLQASTAGKPPLTHRWLLTGPLGTVSVFGNPASWVAPAAPAAFQVRLELSNAYGTVTSGSLPLNVTGATFGDVPTSHWAWRFIEAIYQRGVTAGCNPSPRLFCPDAEVSRAEMAVFLLISKEGPGYSPPACVTPTFGDVPCSHSFSRWINELARRGVTGGCGGGNYCPNAKVSRGEMAVFLLATRNGPGWSPGACLISPFLDVPCGENPFAPWVRDLVAQGITAGCGGGNYCPNDRVNRAQMAVFLTMTFHLPMP